MAQKFNIVAQLNLQGPTNVKKVVSDLQRQLSNVTANVNVQLNNNAAKSVRQVTKDLGSLDNNAKKSTKTLDSLNKKSKQTGATMGGAAKSLNEAASAAENFGKQSALAVKRFAAFSVGAGILGGFVKAVKDGTSAAIEFERELVKVAQVTGRSLSSLGGLTKEITTLSTSMGVASDELANVSRILAQTGLSARDTTKALKALAQSSLAPTFKDMTNTAEGAIAIMRQFEVSADRLGKKLGSINALAGQFAVESQDLIFAIRRAGGAFKAAGGQLEELLALFTSVRATTRESAETIATGFRTIFTRIQRPRTIEFLRQAGVELQNLQGQFVGPFEAIKRLNKALSELESTDPRFQQIIEELGGFRQVSKVIPLIQQFGTAQKALQVAMRGQGSLVKDAATAQQSLAVQMVKVREQFLALFRDLTGSDAFKGLAKGALGMATALIKVGESLKPILPLMAGLAAFQGLRLGAQFVGGFMGGARGSGGARGMGERIGGGGGGGAANRQAQIASRQIQALSTNTQAISKLTQQMVSLTSGIQKLQTTINARGGFGGAGRMGGGRRRGFATGGVVPGVGNGDTVPAMLEPGEFVIRKSSVKEYGVENLQRMNKGGKKTGDVSRSRRFGPGAQSYADRRSKRFAKRMSGGAGKAYAFDFDDTLAESDAVEKHGAADPYEDFRGKRGANFVRGARATKIAGMASTRASRGHDIYVVTARPNDRSTKRSIGHFMRGIGAPAKDVIGVGGTPGPGGTGAKKAQVLARLKKQYGDITFLDDNDENVLAASQVAGVKSIKAKKARGGIIQMLAGGGAVRSGMEDAFYNKPGFTQDQGKGPQYQKEWDLSFGITQMLTQKFTKGRKMGRNQSWKRDMAAIKQQHNARMARIERDPPWEGGDSVEQMVSPALIRDWQEFKKKGGLTAPPPKTYKDRPGGTRHAGDPTGRVGKYATGGRISHTQFEKGRQKRAADQKFRSQVHRPEITGRFPGPELSQALYGMQINEIEKLTDYNRYTPEQRLKQLKYEGERHRGRIRALKAIPEGPEKGAAFKKMVPSISYDKLKKYVAQHGQQWPEGYALGGKVSSGRGLPAGHSLLYGATRRSGRPPTNAQKRAATKAAMKKGPKALDIRGFGGKGYYSKQPIVLDPNDSSIGGFYIHPDNTSTTVSTQASTFDITNPKFRSEYVKTLKQQGLLTSTEARSRVPKKLKGQMKGGSYAAFGPQEASMKKGSTAKAIDKGAISGMKAGIQKAMTAIIRSNAFNIKGLQPLKGNISAAKEAVAGDANVLKTVGGFLFESVLQSLTGVVPGGDKVPMDLPNITGSQRKKMGSIFGEGSEALRIAEVKRSQSALKGADGLQKKVYGEFNKRKGRYGQVASMGNQTLGKPRQMASGGGISGSDTVPALLTPGEFVINKKSAQRIGYGALDKINKGQAQGFATGGRVQKFRRGGRARGGDDGGDGGAGMLETGANRAAGALMAMSFAGDSLIQAFGGMDEESEKLFRTVQQTAMTFGALQGVLGSLDLGTKLKGLSTNLDEFGSRVNLASAGFTQGPGTSKFTRGLGKASKSLSGFTKRLGGMVGPVTLLVSAFVALQSIVIANTKAKKEEALASIENANSQTAAMQGLQDFITASKEANAAQGAQTGGLTGIGIGTLITSLLPMGRAAKLLTMAATAIGGYFTGQAIGASGGVETDEAFGAMERSSARRIGSRMEQASKNMTRTGVNTVGLGNVSNEIQNLQTLQTRSLEPKNIQAFEEQLQRSVPKLQGFVDEIAKNSMSMNEFETKFGGMGDQLLYQISEITGVPVEELQKQVEIRVKNNQLMDKAEKDRLAALQKQAEIGRQLDVFVSALKRASDGLYGLESASNASFAMGMGGDVQANFGGAALQNDLIGRAAAGETVDEGLLQQAIQASAPNAQIAAEATGMTKLTQQLPDILRQAVVESQETGGQLDQIVENKLRSSADFGDLSTIPRIMSQLRRDLGSVQKGGESAVGDEIIADAVGAATKYAGEEQTAFLGRLNEINQLILDAQDKLVNLLTQRNKMEQELNKRNQKARQSRNRLDDFRRERLNPAMTGRGSRGMSVEKIMERDLERQRTSMGGTRGRVAGVAGDPAAIAEEIRLNNEKRDQLRKEIEQNRGNIQEMSKLEVELQNLNGEAENLRNGLEAAADTAEAMGALQSELDRASGERNVRAGLVNDIAWGDDETRQATTANVIGAMGIAQGMSPSDLTLPGQRQGTRALLTSIGDRESGLLRDSEGNVQTGTEVLRAGTERELKKILDPQGTGQFKDPTTGKVYDEDEFNELVDLTLIASRTEKEILIKMEGLQERAMKADEESAKLLAGELIVQDAVLHNLVQQQTLDIVAALADSETQAAKLEDDKAQDAVAKAKVRDDAAKKLTGTLGYSDAALAPGGALTNAGDLESRISVIKDARKAVSNREALSGGLIGAEETQKLAAERKAVDAPGQTAEEVKQKRQALRTRLGSQLRQSLGADNVDSSVIAEGYKKLQVSGDAFDNWLKSKEQDIIQKGNVAEKTIKQETKALTDGGLTPEQVTALTENTTILKDTTKAISDLGDALKNLDTKGIEDAGGVTGVTGGQLTAAQNAQIATDKKLAKTNETLEQIKKNQERVKAEGEKQVQKAKDTNLSRQDPGGLAGGGRVSHGTGQNAGPLTKGTDTRLTVLTPGEFVVRKSQAQKHGALLNSINSGQYASDGGEILYRQSGGSVLSGNYKKTKKAVDKSPQEFIDPMTGEPIVIPESESFWNMWQGETLKTDSPKKFIKQFLEKRRKWKKGQALSQMSAAGAALGFSQKQRAFWEKDPNEKRLAGYLSKPVNEWTLGDYEANAYDDINMGMSRERGRMDKEMDYEKRQLVMAGGGLLPVVGIASDAAATADAFAQGKYGDAVWNAASIIPFFGMFSGGLKGTKGGLRLAKLAKKYEDATLARKMFEKIAKKSTRYSETLMDAKDAKKGMKLMGGVANLRIQKMVETAKAARKAGRGAQADRILDNVKNMRILMKERNVALHVGKATKMKRLLAGSGASLLIGAGIGVQSYFQAVNKAKSEGDKIADTSQDFKGNNKARMKNLGKTRVDVGNTYQDQVAAGAAPEEIQDIMHMNKSHLRAGKDDFLDTLDQNTFRTTEPGYAQHKLLESAAADSNNPEFKKWLGTFLSAEQMKNQGVEYKALGGRVSGAGTRDSVPAVLTPGEFVMNRAAVSRIGAANLQALNAGGAVDNNRGVFAGTTTSRYVSGDASNMGIPEQGLDSTAGLNWKDFSANKKFLTDRELRKYKRAIRAKQSQTTMMGGGQGGLKKMNRNNRRNRPGGAFVPPPSVRSRAVRNQSSVNLERIRAGASALNARGFNKGGLVGGKIRGGRSGSAFSRIPIYRQEGGGVGFPGIEDVALPSGEDVENTNTMSGAKIMAKMMAHVLDELRKGRQEAKECCSTLIAAINGLPVAIASLIGGAGGGGQAGSGRNIVPLTRAQARANEGTDTAVTMWEDRFGASGPGSGRDTGSNLFDELFGEYGTRLQDLQVELGLLGANVMDSVMSGGTMGMDSLLQMAQEQMNPQLLIAGANQAALQATESGAMGGIQAQGAANAYIQQNLPLVTPGSNFNHPDPNDVEDPEDDPNAPRGPVGPARHPTSALGGPSIDFTPVTDVLTRIESCVCSMASMVGQTVSPLGGISPSSGGGGGGSSMLSPDSLDGFVSGAEMLSQALTDFNNNFGGGNIIQHNMTLTNSDINVNITGLSSITEMVREEITREVGTRLMNVENKLGMDGGSGRPGPT